MTAEDDLPERRYHSIKLSTGEKYYICGDESGIEELLKRNNWSNAEVWSFWTLEDLHNWENNPEIRPSGIVRDIEPPQR